MTDTTHTTAAENRARLLSMAAGGDGHADMWIEHATYEATEDKPEADVYLLHIPPRCKSIPTTDGGEFCGTLKQCRSMAHLLCGMPDGYDFDKLTPEETLRRVPPQRQLSRVGDGCLRLYGEP